MGCASHVNPQAAGVNDLANLGIRHLDIHEPSVKHSLESVLDVERQVQVVNGVRYILTLSIHYNKCSEIETENCASSKTCKITILVKPQVKLSNGANYRAILANNCTEEWQYGDNGEVLPELSTDKRKNNQTNANVYDDDIRAEQNKDVQSLPNQERSLTDEEVKNLQDQILPHSQFQKFTESDREVLTKDNFRSDTPDVSKQHVFKDESGEHGENSIPVTESGKIAQASINPDKKKAIEDMLEFFDFSGFKSKAEVEEVIPRIKRSYENDLQVLSLVEDFHDIKKSIESARFVYEMAQAMVDYLNEIDIEVKNRAVKNVIRAEEEIENLHHFVYVQARVTIPCDKVECNSKDLVTQICNGVIDSTSKNTPQILNSFCYDDSKERDYRDPIKEISVEDPVLQSLAKEAVKKIESESTSKYAIKINKIVTANLQITSGTLTKFTIIIDNISCNKSVPIALRINCTVLEQLGSKICEILVHERHWLKERTISYTCTDRPVDMQISKSKSIIQNITVDDPKIIEMLQEAIQYLETQSDKSNKQKIVHIKSISSQIIAGFLTKIEFVVGYTNCTYEIYSRDQINKCELLLNEGLRLCKAQIWDRSWIIDGRKVEVSCDDNANKSNEIVKTKKKRSIDFVGTMEQDVNNNNVEYKKLADESLKKYLHSLSSGQHYKVVKVDRVTVQDVSGKLTTIDFTISPTNCLIQSDGLTSLPKCDIVNSENVYRCHSKILEHIWLDKNQYSVNCKTKSHEQQIKPHTDDLKKENSNDSKYYLLAEESLKKYLHDTGNSPYNYRIVRVEEVTTQHVSGLITSIDFIISATTKAHNDNDIISCHTKILEKRSLGSKEFNVTCHMQETKKSHELMNPKYLQMAVESLQIYIKNNPGLSPIRVTFVDKVTHVGEITKLGFMASCAEDGDGDTFCQAEFSDEGLLRNDIKVKCYSIGTISRNTVITEKDPEFLKYLQLADESLIYYHEKTNRSQHYTVINIENIIVQWDNGIKTQINFIASPEEEDNEMQEKRCHSEIREQPWLYNKQFNVKCDLDKDLYRTKRQVLNAGFKRQLGGLKQEDPTGPRYKVLAEESLQQYVQQSGVLKSLKVYQVVKVTTQVAAGLITRVDFLISGRQDSDVLICHSKIWEHARIDKKDIKVSCQNDNRRVNRKSYMTGGLMEQDPTNPKYKKLAEESLRKYEIDSGISSLVVDGVFKVSTQVVSGSLTHIDFIASGGQDANKIKCYSKVWEQPWLNNKNIEVTCQSDNQRVKRNSNKFGGLMEQDATNPKYKQLAEESLRKYEIDYGISSLVVDGVIKVSTQVVSGLLTHIDFIASGGQDANKIKCYSKVWEQPWLSNKNIEVNCQNDNRRVNRKSYMTGGLMEQDATNPKYKQLAEESLRKYEIDSGISSLVVDGVVKVSTQVVSGSLTHIDFIASGGQDANKIKCYSKVWEQPWLNNKNIEVTCQSDNQRVKRSSDKPGGLMEQDATNPKYKQLAEESLRKYEIDSGISSLVVDGVVKVSTQVVSGSLTHIDFIASGGQDANKIKCYSKVWEQPWLNNKNIEVTCQCDNQRVKRNSNKFGGLIEQDATNPKYKQLAEESLRKYEIDSGISSLVVDGVVKVSTQVVSGSRTHIDFIASGGQDANKIKCYSKVWEQPWLNNKNIEVTCQSDNQRVKRSSDKPGGLMEQDATNPKYKQLAEESLRKYEIDSGISSLVVDGVVKVSTQVVSGSLTHIDFIASGGQDANKIKCYSKVWEQPWLNNKNIEVTCQSDNQRVKRNSNKFGGLMEQDATNPKYKQLAEESLRKYEIDYGISSLVVDGVIKVSTQVVSGLLTHIDFIASGGQDANKIKCYSKVWEQPWLNNKNIEVTCQSDNQRVKRSSDKPGGLMEQDATNPKYKQLAEESLRKYESDSGISSLVVDGVVKVSTQVVSGLLTHIDFIASGGQDANKIKCYSKVWEQPWLNNKNIEVTCQSDNQRVKRNSNKFGGLMEQDAANPKYKQLAEESLRKYEIDSGISSLVVDGVVKVSTQVVSGSLTHIDFIASGGQDANKIKCYSKVWEQPWLNNKNIEVTCQSDNQRVKRSSDKPGGLMEQDATNPKYKQLAEESLRKYESDSGISSLVVDGVVKVSTQVVSGSLTHIDFIASGGQDANKIKCYSKVWEQPWLNNKNIEVTCQKSNERLKRRSVGGSTDKNLSDPRYLKLANESMIKYLESSDNKHPHRVVRLEKVTTQIVSGSITSIDFTISPIDNPNSIVINCHSDVWEQPLRNTTEGDVHCNKIDETRRVKREVSQANSSKKYQLTAGILRGHLEEEQNPNKKEYKLLAEEALRKYEKKNTIYHKIIDVKRVVTRVVSGFKYKIDFSAAPTTCSANVSKFHARSCAVVDDVTLDCHAEIWNRPWLKQKKIDIQCHGPDNDDFDEYENGLDATEKIIMSSSIKNTNDKKYKLLAEEASEKYLTTSNRKYVHKVTDIHGASEHIADRGTITKIEYSLSPTTCLRNETRSSNDTCEIKLPLIVMHCNVTILDRPWLHLEKDIKVNCKINSERKKHKRELGVRTIRQIGDDDDAIDEETTYYYADRAVQHVNDQSSSNNLHKLVTIHAVQSSEQMNTMMVRMYIEIAETYCLRHHREVNLHDCEEMDGLNHRLCLARLWPSPDDELVVRHVTVVCDDDQDFDSITALNIPELLRMSIVDLERSPDNKFKLVHQGEPQVIPTLNSKLPIKINFIIATTNCSKDVNLNNDPYQCYIDTTLPSKACHSFIWLNANTKTISYINAKCNKPIRSKRSVFNPANVTSDDLEIKKLVMQTLDKLEMTSLHRYKQRLLQINSYSTKITSGKVTTIDFDVGYTTCLKYEWVENITSCDFLEHLPRRCCVAQIFERLWIKNGRHIDVKCVDDETPLESHIEFSSAEMANQLAREALKHIEAKYPHPQKQKIVRIFSLEKQVVAGIHYRMKVEVGLTDCVALSDQTDCKLEQDLSINKFCRVNVWIRPWTDHPPNFRVSCDFQEGATHDLYHHVQAEHLFYNFLTTYNPSYVDDYSQMQKRFEIFKTNIKKIHELNVHEKGTATYGVTRFTDLSYEEFSSRYMGLKTSLRHVNQVPMKEAEIPDVKVPQNFDWRDYDAVTEVKDQGSCGSCWAFSVVGNIEGQWKMQSGKLVSLSEQELVDCDQLDDGCNGGLPDNAYRAIEQLGGLESEIDYPYEATDDKCEFNKTLTKVKISGAVNITSNETGMSQWLLQNGPISIGINANAMQFYMGGISHPWKMLCNPTNLDHGVLIVGFGVKEYPLFQKHLPYWIVKNSWGKAWGEEGYYRVYRGDGTCGVNQMASSAVI